MCRLKKFLHVKVDILKIVGTYFPNAARLSYENRNLLFGNCLQCSNVDIRLAPHENENNFDASASNGKL